MTHDPYFPAPRDWWRTCICDLVAQVRADEKAKWTHVCPDNNCCHQSTL